MSGFPLEIVQAASSLLQPHPRKERKKQPCNGKLIVSILSLYDIPYEGVEPKSVILETLGETYETGPPNGKHVEKNAFRFTAGSKDDSDSCTGIVINAPLASIYNSMLKFRVVVDNNKDLVGTCNVASVVRVNETKWLILNLSVENDDDKISLEPTLRIKIELLGSFRQDISTIISIANSWFQIVDKVANASESTVHSLSVDLPKKYPAVKLLCLPMVPFTAIGIAFLPIVLGVLTIGLPFFLPIFIVLGMICSTFGIMCTGFYFSTKSGRKKLAEFASPMMSTLVSTGVGQRFLYDTGPRPSPKHLAQLVLPTSTNGKLVASLIIDFIGSSSYFLLGLGEVADITWAPIQYVCVAAMYDPVMPSLKYISFIEEILPFTDVFPSATVGWLREFTPMLLDQGKRKIHELSIVMRREKQGINDYIRNQ